MPTPWSATLTWSIAPCTWAAVTISPPSGEYFTAFSIKLFITWAIRLGSTSTS